MHVEIRGQFIGVSSFLSPMWISGIKLKVTGLVTSTFHPLNSPTGLFLVSRFLSWRHIVWGVGHWLKSKDIFCSRRRGLEGHRHPLCSQLKLLPDSQWWAPSQAQGCCRSHSNPMAVRSFVMSFLQIRTMRSRGTDHWRLGGLGHCSKEKGAVETKPRWKASPGLDESYWGSGDEN